MKLNKKNIKIKTPSGWQSFSGMSKIKKPEYLHILLSNSKIINCSLNHIFIKDGIEILSSDLTLNDYIDSDDGQSKVYIQHIKRISDDIDLFDINQVEGGKLFNVNGIVSHNCDCSFISSGNNVIEGDVLQWYDQNTVLDPIEERGFDKNLWIWKRPDYTRNYVVVADVARGDGGDYSACHVIDIETVEQVAEYKGKIGTKEYGNFLVNLATEYNDALLVIENANIGWAVIQEAIDREYKNLFYSSTDLNYVDTEVQMRKGIDLKDKYDLKPGFSTTMRTRPLIISKLEEYMNAKEVIIRSKRLTNELFTFIWNGSKAEAQSGYNDDLTMACSIALWVRDTALKLRQQGIELTRQSLNNIKITTGMYNPRTSQLKDSGWSMRDGAGNDEDITWLK